MNKCENCEEEHEGKYGSGRFCSNKCSKSFSSKVNREETNKKISKSLLNNKNVKKKEIEYKKCKECNNDFLAIRKIRIFCSNKCSATYQKQLGNVASKLSLIVKEKVKNGTHIGWQSRKIRSYAEKFFETVLINNGIKYDSEYKISKKELGLNEIANYFLDFYLIDYNIDLEIDGKQHEYTERKIKDKIRDEALIKNGYNVYRIKWKNPNNEENKNYIKNEIDKLLSYIKTSYSVTG